MKNDDLGPGRVHPLTDDELERLEKLAAKATPGPWVKIIRGVCQGVYAPRGEVCRNVVRATDALYIAAACNAAPSLVAEVSRLREKLDAEHSAWRVAEVRGDGLEMENAALRERVEALEKTQRHLEETARVLAEQIGKGNLGKIQDALTWAEDKAREREALTCHNCGDKMTCEFAFDAYNTGGDCLGVK